MRIPLPLGRSALPLILVLGMQALALQRVHAEGMGMAALVDRNFKPFKTLCYSGYRSGQAPWASEPTESEVREDLRLLAPFTHAIRTYGSGKGAHGGKSVPKICDELGLELHLGIWVDNTYDEATNRAALQDAIDLVKEGHPSIRSIIVGNEFLYRVRNIEKPMPDAALAEARLVNWIKMVRAAVPKEIQVTYADTWGDWIRNGDALIQSVDYVIWHTHPWWENKRIEETAEGIQYASNQVKARLAKTSPVKPALLGEVGWPSAVTQGQAVGSEANQARFFKDLHAWAYASKQEYWAFATFDEDWKSAEGPVGGVWGLWNSSRQPKPVISSLDTIIPKDKQWEGRDGPVLVLKAYAKNGATPSRRAVLEGNAIALDWSRAWPARDALGRGKARSLHKPVQFVFSSR